MSDFYLTLPSNSSTDIFPNNTLTKYYVKLERYIDLEKYVVGLIELQYPVTWQNIWGAKLIISFPERNESFVAKLRDGRYNDTSDLLNEIHQHLLSYRLEKTIHLFQDTVTKKVFLTIKDDKVFLKLSQNLTNILGLESKSYGLGIHEGNRQCDIDEGQTSFYVYTNIVQNQMVGNTMAPLLRVVPLRGKKTDTYRTEEFQHVIYVPTINSSTEIIEIDIRRDDGLPVSFQTGKVIATLHFKVKQ